MPKTTGIKNRAEYLKRLFVEDKKIAGKDKEYGEYLNSLSELLALTDAIYDEKGGKLDKASHEALVNQYLKVAQKSSEYKTKGKSKTRANVVDYIQKVISKDLKALNSIDKENPGMLQDAFESSRAVKVEVPADLSNRVGGQMSDRFPMKSANGKKGYFTARTHTAQDEKWNQILDSIEALGLDKEYMKKINELRTDHELRTELQYEISKYENDTMKNFVVALGICTKPNLAGDYLNADPKLKEAMKILATDGKKLLFPYNMQDRLGYDPYTRNDNKNAAMYDVAKLLGCEKIIAKAVPMVVVNGNQVIKGTFMENAEGNDLGNLKSSDLIWFYNPKETPYHKDLFRDLADMQVLDYICGNIDRHKGNMLYKVEKDINGNVKMTGIVGIDNDASFPEKEIDKREFKAPNKMQSARIFKPKNFRFVNKNTAEIIKKLNRGQLEAILRGHNLSKKAIDLAWERTKEVQKALEKEKEYNISYVDDLDENITRNVNDQKNPFNEADYEKNPSIFTGFDRHMDMQVNYEKQKASIAQAERFRKARDYITATKLEFEKSLDTKELVKHLDKVEQERESKFSEYRGTTKESALLADGLKIESMDKLMNDINRLKTPSKEFAQMRDAVFALKTYHKELSLKIRENTALTSDEYKEYEQCLKNLDDATKNYIKEKGITPKTAKGRERLDAATSIENRVEELIRSFEADKKLDSVQVEEPNKENSEEMGLE